ncbi:MAG: cell wall metabolism sensor histidine kinase WalK [Calditrichaeota bacterium]|nr:cell wall metabolism sensor histidine kinase WalK [Calditrichota bacterium]
MEIKGKFSLKIFLSLFVVIFIPVAIVFLNLARLQSDSAAVSPEENFWFFLIVLAVAIALAALATRALCNSLYERMHNYNKIARKIAGGQFELRIPVDADDELGKFGRFFNMLTKEHHEIKKKNVGEKLFEWEKIQAILKNIGDGVIVIDNFNRIELMNAVSENWFNVTKQDYQSMELGKLITDEKLLGLIEKVKNGTNTSEEKVEIEIVPENQRRPIILQAIATKVIGDNRKLFGLAIALRDLTREKEIDRKKSEVVSMVSHELRSPLTSITGFSELLLDEGVSREQSREYTAIILKESRRLSELINKYLDISRIESGKSEIHKTPVTMDDVIQSVVSMNAFLSDSKNIQTKIRFPEKVSQVNADRQMMGEVILNLFSNAVKYSPPDTTITISIEETGNEQIISVADQGYGISEQDLDRIFDKFYRATGSAEVQEEKGSGLGLALVKEIIHRHNGRVWAESRPKQGSTFFIALPIMEKDAILS